MADDRPNALGRMLRYFTSAVAYARQPYKAAGQQRRYSNNPLLSSILEDNSKTAGSDSSGLDYYARLGLTNPFFYSALKIIGERVTDTGQFYVEEKKSSGKWEKVEGHEFLDVFERPNALMTGGLMLGLLAEWMNTAGNAYLFLVTETPGVGPIQEIWPLPAFNVQPEPMTLRVSPFTDKPIIDYKYTLARPIILPGENIVHIRTPNLFDFWRGMAPLSALQSILAMDAAETSWLASYFGENNAVPTAVISVPPDLSDQDFDMVKRDIVEQFGAQRRSAITRAGDISVETIQHTIEEMKVLEGMGFNREAIERVLRVPSGLFDSSSGQSRLAAETALMRDAIQPLLNNIASWLTLKAMPMYGDNLRVAAEDIVPQDSAIETAKYQAYGPDRTLNENRKEQKLPPLKLKGDLAPFQNLLDDVPQRWFELFFPVVQQKVAPPPAPPGMPGMPGAPGALPGAAPGQPGQPAQLTGPTQNGESSPKTPSGMGPRTTGQQTNEQLLAGLLGDRAAKAMLAGLPDYEREAAQAWLATQASKALIDNSSELPLGVEGLGEVMPARPAVRPFAYKMAQYRATMDPVTSAVKAVYRVRGDGALVGYDSGVKRWVSADVPAGASLIPVEADVVRRFIAKESL